MKITETIVLEGSTVRCTIPQYAHVEDPEAPGGYDIHTADRQAELSYLEFIEQIITPIFDDLNRFGIPDEDTVEVITQRVLRQVDSRLATTATLHLDEPLEILLTKDDGYHVELIKYAGKGVYNAMQDPLLDHFWIVLIARALDHSVDTGQSLVTFS